MMAVAKTLGVSRSNLHDRLNGSAKPRRGYHKAQDAAVLPRIEALVAKRPTYGYRRITALLNRELRTQGCYRLLTINACTASWSATTCCCSDQALTGQNGTTTVRSL